MTKQQATIPRLELCAADLATDLLLRLQKDLDIEIHSTFLWTDSQIVLAWINSTSSATLPVFVANRVSRIQRSTISQQWNYVPSKENPADVLSRGIAPERLNDCHIWFYGPKFLHGPVSTWPPKYKAPVETHLSITTITKDQSLHTEDILNRINHRNSFKTAVRIIAYVLRYINNLKQKILLSKISGDEKESKTQVRKTYPTQGPLTVSELDDSKKRIFKLMQKTKFKNEVTILEKSEELPRNNQFSSLTPFLDDQGLIRVGGRLEESSLPYDAKHPILIPYDHDFSKMFLTSVHENNNHVGPQTMLSIARQTVWPIKGKTLARSVYHKCIKCARATPRLLTQQMGNLPADRIQPARPFINTGVDFCGPIITHYKVRGKKPQKSYISIFCCFATKACHLELVTDLTSHGFIGALKRFTARRGHYRNIYCDNATNFVGARNKLSELIGFMDSEKERDKIISSCTSTGCDFHFIPPRSPHFGGLWEAAVKSSKHLLQHVLAGASLTYEELETVITQVESILNSRPLTPMSSSPNDLTALTPGHFLIGEPLTSNIDSTAATNNSGLLARWNLVNHLKDEFWRRWSRDYLNQLQHRCKWRERCQNAENGMMVLIKEDNIPSLKWPLGRITNVITGNDGLVRVADVRTANGTFRRAIHRLAPLPIPIPDHEKEPEEIVNLDNVVSTLTHSFNEPDDEPIPKKKFKSSIGPATLSLLLISLFLPMIACSRVHIKPFQSQPGIYFENFGTSVLTSSSWNIIAYYDLEPYWTEYNSIWAYSNKLSDICERLPHTNETCRTIILQFNRLYADLKKDNDLLLATTPNQRTRRGAVNFVGNVANALFGVLDDEYAKNMAAIINTIQQDEGQITHLIKNQTSIIDATLNIIKTTEQDTISHFKEIDKSLQVFTEITNGITQQYNEEKLRQIFNAIALQLILVSTQFQKTQGSLIDVIIDTHHGRISPQLISPTQLGLEITKIRANLPSTVRLPVGPDELTKLYHLMSIHGKIMKKQIIFKIGLPLLTLEEFEVFKITPVPVLIGESLMTIAPSTDYIMINLHRDQYYLLSTTEFQECISLDRDRYMCQLQHPVYRRGSGVGSCEVGLLINNQQSPSCKLVRANNGPHWIPLRNHNEWIYVLRSRNILSVVCNNSVGQIELENSGILQIQPDCVLKDDFITLRGHSSYKTMSRVSISPSVNLSEFTLTNNEAPTSQHSYSWEYRNHLKEIDALKQKIYNVTMNLPSSKQYNEVHHFTVSYAGLIVSVVILLGLLRWLICRRYKKKSINNTNCKRAISPNENDANFEITV